MIIKTLLCQTSPLDGEMREGKDKTPEAKHLYWSPKIKKVPVTMQGVLCLSGNGSMYEKDLGDGGFTED